MKSIMLIDTALLILRAAIGTIFLAHGSQKLFGAGGINGFAGMLQGLGFTPAHLWAYAAALSEGVGGFLLLLGIAPRLSAGLIAMVMLVAIIKVHGVNGFFMAQGGFEYQFLILMSCVALILTGAGKLSLYNKL